MPRSPLTEQYQRVMSLVEQLHALEPDERNFILDLLVPESEPVKKSQKKSSKKSAGGGGRSSSKSARAASISNQIHRAVEPSTTESRGTDNDDDTNQRCQAKRSDGRTCMLLADHNIHHLTTAMDHHEFVPPAEQAAGMSGD